MSPLEQEPWDRLLPKLPARPRRAVEQVLSSWVGGVALTWAWKLRQIEIFDRSMAIAAQLFTAVFPTMILIESWFGDSSRVIGGLTQAPPAVADSLDEVVAHGASATFGVLGTIIVFASATSLSRALARAFAAVWELPRPRNFARSIWRWLAVVLAFVLTVEGTRALTDATRRIPPPELWNLTLGAVLFTAVAVFVPWVLLQGRVAPRLLLPGAAVFALVLTIARPFTQLWMPRALESSAAHYGAVGVAFAYLAWLYVVAWVFLASAALGQALVGRSST